MDQDFAIEDRLPSEAVEQERVVVALRRAGVPHFAVPSGGKRSKVTAAQLRRQGVVPGVPDLVLPGSDPRWRCLGVEMKRQRGGRISGEQQAMHSLLRACGWVVLVCEGAEDALRQLRGLGVPV